MRMPSTADHLGKQDPSAEVRSSFPLIVIVGPTAVGKTSLSISLAQRLDAEVVSADSRLLYRGMDIGTAKPTPEQRSLVPHHLIDVTDPDVPWDLARFKQEATSAIEQINSRGHLALLVGGTGQYVHAVTENWELPSARPDLALRAKLEERGHQLGPEALHRTLAKIDPQAAQRIDPHNLRRTARALEVMLTTGKRFSEQSKKAEPAYPLIMVGLTRPREELYTLIDQRIELMFANGLVDEVATLLRRYPPDLPAFSAIGYRQVIAYLQGKMTLDEAKAAIRRASRNFVRHQANWFSAHDPEITWFRPDEPAAIIAHVESRLAG